MKSEIVKAEIERLLTEHGGLLPPAAIVNAARPETSVLHPYFEWDDTVAAEQYRLVQARQMIRIIVSYEGAGDAQQITRTFVSLTTDRTEVGGGYRSLVDVMTDEEQRQQFLTDALNDFKRWRIKYQKLTELAEIFAAHDIVQEQQRTSTSTEATL